MFYTYEWWTLTFRPELLLFRLYLYALVCALTYNLMVFNGDDAYVLGLIMFIILTICSIPFLPAILLFLSLPAIVLALSDASEKFNLVLLDALWMILFCTVCITWPWVMGLLSKKVFAVSRDTYLC